MLHLPSGGCFCRLKGCGEQHLPQQHGNKSRQSAVAQIEQFRNRFPSWLVIQADGNQKPKEKHIKNDLIWGEQVAAILYGKREASTPVYAIKSSTEENHLNENVITITIIRGSCCRNKWKLFTYAQLIMCSFRRFTPYMRDTCYWVGGWAVALVFQSSACAWGVRVVAVWCWQLVVENVLAFSRSVVIGCPQSTIVSNSLWISNNDYVHFPRAFKTVNAKHTNGVSELWIELKAFERRQINTGIRHSIPSHASWFTSHPQHAMRLCTIY